MSARLLGKFVLGKFVLGKFVLGKFVLGNFVLGNFVMGNFGAHPAQACRLKQQSAIFLFFPFSKEVFS